MRTPVHRSLYIFLLAMMLPASGWTESSLALARKGNELYTQERYSESIENYRRALEQDPDEPVIRYNLGTALAKDKRFDQAQEILRQAAGEPNRYQSRAAFNLGVARAEEALKDQPQLRMYLERPLNGSTATPPQIEMKVIDQSLEKMKEARQAFRESILTGNPKETLCDERQNYELANTMVKRLEELKKQMQQQQQQNQQQQDQQNQDQNQEQDQDQNQNQDQQQQNRQNEQQQQQDQQQNQEEQDQQGEEQQQQENQQQEQQPPPQQPQQAEPREGEAKEEPLSTGQMDAMRLLNLVEQEKPEQFKKLFKFRGQFRQSPNKKDW